MDNTSRVQAVAASRLRSKCRWSAMMLTMVIMTTMAMVTLLLLLVHLFAVFSPYKPSYHDPATVEPCRGPGSNRGDCTQAAEQSGRQRQPKVSSRMSPLPQVLIRCVFAFVVGLRLLQPERAASGARPVEPPAARKRRRRARTRQARSSRRSPLPESSLCAPGQHRSNTAKPSLPASPCPPFTHFIGATDTASSPRTCVVTKP